MKPIIEVLSLRRTYASTVAVDDVSFEVHQGEIFGIVGPNGAGKTTTLECIEGLRTRDRGEVRVLGLDPVVRRETVAQRVGVQLQESALPARLRVAEALTLFACFYSHPAPPDELLAKLGLVEKRDAPFGKLSGGQKQRLFIALALINRPEVVFFDELTTGLDPQARRATWDLVRQVREAGATVTLTTHSMEEAERLCDRVMIMDHGRIVGLDTPEALIRAHGGDRRVVFTLAPGAAPVSSLDALPAGYRVEQTNGHLTVHGHGDRFVSSIAHAIESAGVPFLDMRTVQPSLEDVFLALTGREMRD